MKRKKIASKPVEFNRIAQAICDKKYKGDKVAYAKALGFAV